jgi:tripartite-type tricarboxylate transporter receptor subunit TctC
MPDLSRRTALAALAIAGLASTTSRVRADDTSAADFYRGKTIQFLIGGAPGVSYDLVGRVIAAHMSRHLPGQPIFVAQNMPGATSLVMTNYLYNQASRDGTVIGMPNDNIILEPQLHMLSRDGGNVRFDLNRFAWLGTPVQEPQIMLLSADAPAHSLEGMKHVKVLMGSSGTGADNYALPTIVNKVFGTKIDIVLGYQGPNDILLAMERGEVQGISAGLSTLVVNRPQWLHDGKAALIMQFGLERLKGFETLPTAIELAPNDDARAIFRMIASKFTLARPLALPPDVPSDRVRALRAAFDATMRDTAFLSDAEKIGLDIDPMGGEQMTKVIQQILATPPSVVDSLRAMLAS